MNSNLSAPRTLEFHMFCRLHTTKSAEKIELGILNSSGITAAQKCNEHITNC